MGVMLNQPASLSLSYNLQFYVRYFYFYLFLTPTIIVLIYNFFGNLNGVEVCTFIGNKDQP